MVVQAGVAVAPELAPTVQSHGGEAQVKVESVVQMAEMVVFTRCAETVPLVPVNCTYRSEPDASY